MTWYRKIVIQALSMLFFCCFFYFSLKRSRRDDARSLDLSVFLLESPRLKFVYVSIITGTNGTGLIHFTFQNSISGRAGTALKESLGSRTNQAYCD